MKWWEEKKKRLSDFNVLIYISKLPVGCAIYWNALNILVKFYFSKVTESVFKLYFCGLLMYKSTENTWKWTSLKWVGIIGLKKKIDYDILD